LLILAGVVLSLTFFFGVSGRSKSAKPEPNQKKEVIEVLPEIISCVPSIRIVKAEIKNAKKENAAVEIEIENMSEIGLVAISLDSTKGGVSYSQTKSTFDSDSPLVIAEPHKTVTLKMEVSNLFPGVPLRIGSVMFANGEEEGCEASIKEMRETRAEHKAQKAAAGKEPK